MEKAIDRFNGQAQTNSSVIYATYTSGNFNGFYASEQEAIDHCNAPESGAEFNGTWYQDSYSTYGPGELCSAPGEEAVFASNDTSRCLDPVGARWEIPCEWQNA